MPTGQLTDKMARQIERFVWFTPKGQRRADLPWDALGQLERTKLPFLLRYKPRLGATLLLAGLTCAFLGWIFTSHGSIAFGAGMTFVALRAYRQAWQRIGQVSVTYAGHAATAVAGEEVYLDLEIVSTSRTSIPRMAIYGIFSGCVEADAYALLSQLKPRIKRRERLEWKADVGMGKFRVHSLKVIVTDDLGLFPIAVDMNIDLEVAVEPRPQPLEYFPIRESGSATDAGAFEARGVGDAVTFRGMRPWRVGDGLRRIDWKRSQRVGALLVKEFERIASTSATVFFDTSSANQSQFGGISTFNVLRSVALGLADWLVAQRIKTNFVTEELNFDLGGSHDDAVLLRELMREMQPHDGTALTSIISKNITEVETDSLVVLFGCAANIELEKLWTSLIHFDEQRVEVILILIDTGQFVNTIQRQIRLEEWDRPFVKSLVSEVQAASRGALGNIAAKLLARTYILGPNSSLSEMATGRAL